MTSVLLRSALALLISQSNSLASSTSSNLTWSLENQKFMIEVEAGSERTKESLILDITTNFVAIEDQDCNTCNRSGGTYDFKQSKTFDYVNIT